MTTYTWEYGSAASGLQFTIVYDDTTNEFTVESLVGSFDLNALWFSDGSTTSDGYVLAKSDNNLNMNGDNTIWGDGTSSAETIVWDDYAKLSSPGSVSGDKITFISAGETQTFTLADFTFDPTAYGTLGVKATSVNGTGTIKWADSAPDVGQVAVPTIAQVTNTPVSETLNDISGDGSHIPYAAPGSGGDFDTFMFHTTSPNPPGGGLLTGTFQDVNVGVGDQTNPHISGDDQFVTYTSEDGNPEIRVFDTLTSTDSAIPSTGFAFLSQISDDGNHVVFTQLSVAGSQIFDWNPNTPGVSPTLVSASNQASNPTVSGDGSVVAYQDQSFNPNPSENDIVIVANSVSTQIAEPGLDQNPSLSADGNYLAFLNSDTTGLNSDVLLYDLTNATLTNLSLSLPTNGEESFRDGISGDGRFVAFTSNSGGVFDLYVWDRDTGDATNVTADWDGLARNATISEDGRYIAFEGRSDGFQFDIYRADNPLHDDFIV